MVETDLSRPGRSAIVAISGLSLVVFVASVLLVFRSEMVADSGVAWAANTARLAVGGAAGGALALAGALRRVRDEEERPLFELELMALASGGAAGGWLGSGVLALSPNVSFLLGGAVGASLSVGLVRVIDRPSRWANVGVAVLLGTFIAVAALAGSYGRGLPGVAPSAIAWLLGDFSTATAWSAWGAVGVVAILVGLSLGTRADPSSALPRLATLGFLAFGFGVGLAGVLAFVGSFVPRTVRALAPAASNPGFIVASVAAGGASVAAIDAVPRWLVGGYALPFDVGIGMLAVPVFLFWNRARLRREVGPIHPVLEAAELFAIVAATAVAAVLVLVLTQTVRSAT